MIRTHIRIAHRPLSPAFSLNRESVESNIAYYISYFTHYLHKQMLI